MKMTPRERIEAVFAGRLPDKTAFSSYHGSAPAGMKLFQQMLADEVCFVTKTTSFSSHNRECKCRTVSYNENEKSFTKTIVETPYGEISQLFQAAQSGKCPLNHFFKSPDDFKRIIAYVDDICFKENYNSVKKLMKYSSDSEIIRDQIGSEPMQMVINYMGVENYCMQWFENRDEVIKLYEAFLAMVRRQYPLAANSPLAFMNCGGNCVPEIIGLDNFKEYFTPFYNEAAEYMHKHKKLIGTHLDANTRLWKEEVASCSLDYIEAFTPPPECDLSVGEALAEWNNKFLWINFPSSAHLGGKTMVKKVFDEIISQAGDGSRLIIGFTEDIPEIGHETIPYLAKLIKQTKLPLN